MHKKLLGHYRVITVSNKRVLKVSYNRLNVSRDRLNSLSRLLSHNWSFAKFALSFRRLACLSIYTTRYRATLYGRVGATGKSCNLVPPAPQEIVGKMTNRPDVMALYTSLVALTLSNCCGGVQDSPYTWLEANGHFH